MTGEVTMAEGENDERSKPDRNQTQTLCDGRKLPDIGTREFRSDRVRRQRQ